VLTGEAVATMLVVAPVTAVVFCTHVPAVVAVAKAALVALRLKARFTLVPGSGIETVRAADVAAGANLKLFVAAVPSQIFPKGKAAEPTSFPPAVLGINAREMVRPFVSIVACLPLPSAHTWELVAFTPLFV
jgi:hypothetical protein